MEKEQIFQAGIIVSCFIRTIKGMTMTMLHAAFHYPTLEDINVKNEWADWARRIFIEEGVY